MVKSMTGFGEGEVSSEGVVVHWTLKMTNHKYLDVRVRGLRDEKALEAKAESYLKDRFSRGRLEAEVEIGLDELSGDLLADWNEIRPTYDFLCEISDQLNLTKDPSLDHLIALGVFESRGRVGEHWPVVREGLIQAADHLLRSLNTEGQALRAELEDHLSFVAELASEIDGQIPEVIQKRKKRLEERVSELLEEGGQLDERRLEEEVAVIADKVDITEEIARIRTHLDNAFQVLEKEEPIGKELEFLARELKREANTVGAKCKDGDLQSLSIDMKLEIEKFNEQVRNVE
ncbi:MAG: YicC/YloC family endoribonuclease [Candidatus Acetothermia bacterium]